MYHLGDEWAEKETGSQKTLCPENGIENLGLVCGLKAWKIFEVLCSLALPSAFLPSNGLLLVSTQGFIRLDMSEFQERHEVSESSW